MHIPLTYYVRAEQQMHLAFMGVDRGAVGIAWISSSVEMLVQCSLKHIWWKDTSFKWGAELTQETFFRQRVVVGLLWNAVCLVDDFAARCDIATISSPFNRQFF